MERDVHARAYARKTIAHTLHALAATSALAPHDRAARKRRRPDETLPIDNDEDGRVNIEDDDSSNDDSADDRTGDSEMKEVNIAYDAVQESAVDVLVDLYESCTFHRFFDRPLQRRHRKR